ncbi:hypothetical protein KR009_003488 [Drosophila setifemur]|nr:hypothetical protein KR009_003488 [Drosophila setifemur]
MSTTSQKFRNFVSEPMRDKDVCELPGIGDKLGLKMSAAGFGTASSVLGMYLLLKQEQDYFEDWLNDICQANSKQANECYRGLQQWCKTFLY